ncbi:VanZ family protein [Haloarcula marina]|uniref:VanZ family protein n=1 Tax=Haloarcula marina TaxID=2961574 RepID=UPI0020B73986|nr:VanZ family protein [Halomicroarcula marina]
MSRHTSGGVRWRRSLVVAAVLLCGSLVPSPLGRHESWRYVGPDKVLHFLGHGGFAAVLAEAFDDGRPGPRRAGLSAIAVSVAYSVVLGRLQEWVPGRMPETADTVAGLLGSVVGVLAWHAHCED